MAVAIEGLSLIQGEGLFCAYVATSCPNDQNFQKPLAIETQSHKGISVAASGDIKPDKMMKFGTTLIAGTAALMTGAMAHNDADAFDASFGKTDEGLLDRIRFGSYGELHSRVGDGADNIDMHRLVAMLDFQFNERLKLVTETEFEHVLYHDEADGEEDYKIEIEQAYLEYMVSNDLYLKAGVMLVPVGIINEVHEPTTFYGVERPNVEKYLIPTTWWEGGVGLVKTYDSGLQVDIMAHTSLDMTKDGYIRSGRPKLDFNQYTENQSWAVTTRAKYTGIAGVELGGALQYQHDVSSTVSGEQTAYLAEAHAIYRSGGFELRALATYWNVQGFADRDTEDQWGYYIEPSYTFDIPWGKFGYFTRFSQYEYYNSGSNEAKEYTAGVNYWPLEEVVLKMDYTNIDRGSYNDETFNFGLGYFF